MQFLCVCQVIGSIQISAQEDFTHVSILIEGNLFRKKLYNEQIKSSQATEPSRMIFIL